ncbi:hypothetical protein WN944_012422 [Citrus x changshan-huyou]|uniref:Pentatricopeptide repeat-containing protein n=1 Tax=Citrus x changshan-huyou TaxID=2935761 RepID=A0AAP0MV59_9ROSI
MEAKNVDSWNFMMSGYANAGLVEEARRIRRGWNRWFYSFALVAIYSKCGDIEKAKRVFRSAKNKGITTWNCTVSGGLIGQSGLLLEAEEFVRAMPQRNSAGSQFWVLAKTMQFGDGRTCS